MRTAIFGLCGILISVGAIAQEVAVTSPQISIQDMARQLAVSDGINKDEAIQIAYAVYRALWGETATELKVSKCELNPINKAWDIVLWWDMGDSAGRAKFRIGTTGSIESAEYIPGV